MSARADPAALYNTAKFDVALQDTGCDPLPGLELPPTPTGPLAVVPTMADKAAPATSLAPAPYWRRVAAKWYGNAEAKRPPRPPAFDAVWSLLLSFISIGVLAAVTYSVPLSDSGFTLLISSAGATAVLLYSAHSSPLAQPLNVIAGHCTSAVVGVTVRLAIFEAACDSSSRSCLWASAALAVSISIAVMQVLHVVHPPGGATALVAVVGDATIIRLRYWYVLVPVFSSALIMVGIALLGNNLIPSRRYPQWWY